MKGLCRLPACKKALIYINIPYNSWIVKTLSSSSHFIEGTIIHIFDNHVIVIDRHNDTYMPVRRRESWPMIDNYSAWFCVIARWFSLFFCISYPVFGITTPCDIFILSDKTSTITPDKVSASFIQLERERVITIRDILLISDNWRRHYSRSFCWLISGRLWSCWSWFFDSRLWDGSLCWVFRGIREE